MKSRNELIEMITWRKKEINLNGWNELDINAVEYEEDAALADICEALKACMLEGDTITAGSADVPSKEMAVRYYCDNLSSERRRVYP